MAVRRMHGSSLRSLKKLHKRRKQRREETRRGLQLERLEERQMLAVGPQLVGIQPNEGDLLDDGDVRNTPPRELTFRFTSATPIDASSLNGIQITRAGFDDETFESASISSDFNTSGAVVIRFEAAEPGPSGNGITVAVTRSARAAGAPPLITVSGRTVQVELNSNATTPTTAQQLVTAINSDVQAQSLVRATITRGVPTTPIGNRPVTYSPLVLRGANAATDETNFNTNTGLLVQFIAKQPGVSGNGIRIDFTKSNHGGVDPPRVTVNGRTITVDLNTNPGNETSASEVVNAINNHAQASQLVTAVLVAGDPNTRVAIPPITYSPLVLEGASDVAITPGFIGLGDRPNEIIVRFQETLPDDRYRIDILGSVLRNTDGEFFNEGRDAHIEFELDLGPQVVAVVPQPVVRETVNGVSQLRQLRNVIHVYFNHDDLNLTVAEDPAFYQLLFTNNSVENTDDVIIPASRYTVDYNAATNRAELTFDADLHQLGSGPGTFRLRIGTDEANPAVPQRTDVTTDPGSSYGTSHDVGVLADVGRILTQRIDPQLFQLDLPGDMEEPGHRDIPERPDQQHLEIDSDQTAGVTRIFYNFEDFYGTDPQGVPLRNAITEAQKERAREIFEFYSYYLGVEFIETDNRGMTIATGDIRAILRNAPTGPGGPVAAASQGLTGTVVLDLQDFSSAGDDAPGGPWFRSAMEGIGNLLGVNHTDELPPLTIQGDEPILAFNNVPEPVFPGDHDIVHGQHLYRPDSKDIDLYRFQLQETGTLSVEVTAERLTDPSLLDPLLVVYREIRDVNGNVVGRERIARNDDYYSEDAFLELDLEAGTYYVGVTASGNEDYDPRIEDTGFGGTSQGNYELRLNFRPNADRSLVDADLEPTAFDGDADGVPGGVFNFWFRVQDAANTIFVDKAAQATSVTHTDGTQSQLFNNIPAAMNVAGPGDIVRIVGNGGADGNLGTAGDNRAYEIGFNRLGAVQADGATLEVPREVTVMIDAGAVFKMRRSAITVGSAAPSIDRSGGAIQVLGTPHVVGSNNQVLLDAGGNALAGSVYFTSLHDASLGTGTNPDSSPPAAAKGDWGGIVLRSDIDRQDDSRFDYEEEGIFLNHINHADMRFGGGSVVINGQPQTINPVHLTDSRPTISYNKISQSAHAAISANPNSFEETNFHAPPFQAIPFTADYDRVGPDIHYNTVTENSLNGLFVRIATLSGSGVQPLSVAGRWDDIDIVHIVSETLVIQGTPGGPVLEETTPPVELVTLAAQSGGTLEPGTYNYRIVFVDAAGNEGPPSDATRNITITGNPNSQGDPGNGTIVLNNLPPAPTGFVARNIYRSTTTGGAPYTRVAQINAFDSSFVDNGTTRGGTLAEFPLELRPRLDARLAIDPGTVVKLDGARIETEIGAQLLAEGTAGHEVVFTSLEDNRYGAGGTFDTRQGGVNTPRSGDWAGIFLGHLSSGSIDHATIAHAGGVSRVEGAFTGFNALEIHQADARITNTEFSNNAQGIGGQAPADRFGRGFNAPSTIFVRGAQPILVDNVIRDNEGPAININVNALNHLRVTDYGRSTGDIDLVPGFGDNQGPLVRGNRIDNNDINGMIVRGGTLTTESVWDDVDIVHVVEDSDRIFVPDFHTFGSLRLESSPTQSLVVKLEGADAGLTATGRPLDIEDRIGGAVHVIGQPGSPVVMTSLDDCTVGAGFTPAGLPQTDTNNTGACGDILVETPFVDVIVIMDESGSMFFAQQFSVGMIADLDAALIGRGIGDGTVGINRFGLVGYGAFDPTPHAIPVGAGGALFGTSQEYATATAQLLDTGVEEDGYWAIDFALDTYQFRPEAEKFIILVTNEDRDILQPNLTFNSVLADLNAQGVRLQGIVTAFLTDGAGNTALAIDGQGTAYLEDGQGGFTTSTGGQVAFASGTTQTDYIDMVFATGGLTGDITQIQAGGVTATSFSAVVAASITGQVGGGATGTPGDWGSIRLDQFSHDRNVETATELEPADATAGPDSNEDPNHAQFLGVLAPNEKAGDDNRRLGFHLHGYLSEPGDVDVYRFDAEAGTEVWLDIDRTHNSLDTVVELVDANGQVIALSDNSFNELQDPTLLFRSSLIASNHVNPLGKSFDTIPDRWSTNPRDAGMRVVLPGTPGQRLTYHVRVRSSNLEAGDPQSKLLDMAQLHAGLTAGAYELQIRLRELDERAGSTIQHSEIRFATNGIEIIGLPKHSPLLGESAEDATDNNTRANAQQLGNLLNTDRAALSVAGALTAATDIDWYELEIRYDSVQAIGGVTLPSQHLATLFDIDYADGLGRANLFLSVFDSDGNLVLTSHDSNIADDRPGPLQGADMDDLSRGTVGPLDPFIGSAELPVGTYYVAVSSDARIPSELGQFQQPNPSNPLFRLEPINSVRRIVEDRIGSTGGSEIPASPEVPVLLDNRSVVPFHLGDVVLFVSQDPGPNNVTNLYTYDAFTGARETQIGRFGRDVGDIALRHNGDLHAFSLDMEDQFPSDAETGNYLIIDTGTAAATNLGDDGIETHHEDPANPGTSQRSNLIGANNRVGYGIQFQGVTYGVFGGQHRGFAVGSRPPFNFSPGVNTRNILYEFNPDTGAATSAPAQDRTGNALINGAGTNIIERGELVTDADPTGSSNTVVIAAEATQVVNGQTLFQPPFGIDDAFTFSIDHDGNSATPPIVYEFNTGPEVLFRIDPANGVFVRDGDTFTIDGTPFEFDTGSVIVVTGNGSSIQDGGTITITDNNAPQGRSVTFEFDRDGAVTGNATPIRYTTGSTNQQIINEVVSTINAQPNFNVQATGQGQRITLLNESRTIGATETASGVQVEGAPGVSPGTRPIVVEESFTATQFGNAILQTFNGPPDLAPGVTVSIDGARLNFSGAINGNFAQIQNRGVFAPTGGNGSVQSTNRRIDFLAADTADDIAQRMTNAINATPGLQATQNGKVVTLTAPPEARFESAPAPLRLGGSAPGGEVTGLAFIGSTMYAVSDRGGLFVVTSPNSVLGAQADYVNTATDLLGLNFQGLVAGPPNAETGQLSNLLFGITGGGVNPTTGIFETSRIYAFDTDGQLQPVLVDGATSVDLGITGVNGLAFSNLDYNLWHITPARGADAGHGVETTFDGSRTVRIQGGNSFYFGFENQARNNIPVNPFTDPGNRFNYDFPGGAHGLLQSHEFSLQGYSPEDKPTLYFNYYLESEDTLYDPDTPNLMRDSFRVYVSSDDGQWQLLTTNNQFKEITRLDEYDALPFDQQESFDNTNSWRQARVDLSPYAGRDNLKLRFEFATAGEMDMGDIRTTGQQLRAIEGNRLRDGQTFTIDSQVFEFDLGFTLVAPTGGAVRDGETFTIDSQTFEFDSGNGVQPGNTAVPFNSAQSALQVAETIEQVVLQNRPMPPVINGDLSAASEPNDTLVTAVNTGITSGSAIYRASGRIDDNPNLTVNPALDVDMLRFQLSEGGNVKIDVDANQIGSALNPVLRLFDANGNQLVVNDNTDGLDPFIDFTATTAGTYFVGISGFANFGYNPAIAGSGTAGTTGFYDIEVTVTDQFVVHRSENRLNLQGPDAVVQSPTPALRVEGQPGATSTAVPVHAGMNSVQVADAVAQSVADVFAGGVRQAIKQHDDILDIIGHNITAGGPLGVSRSLFGDQFGAFEASTNFDGTTDRFNPGALRGQNNNFEGLYIDDLIIGFAERGEMATGSTADNNFVNNEDLKFNQVLVGPYQLEVRRGEQYGTSVFPPNPNIILNRSFDTNDRLAEQQTIFAPAGHNLVEGQTFRLSDGVDTVIFEFDDQAINNGVAAGHVRIPFNTADSAPRIAQRIRDAINSPQTQALLDVIAGLADGTAAGGGSTDNRVNLYGNAVSSLISPSLVVTETTQNGNQLRDAILGPGIRPVGNATFIGSGASAGFFEGGLSSIGMEDGIVLTTGNANFASGPNTADGSTGSASLQGDPDLDAEFGEQTLDTTVLEFQFELLQPGDLFFNFVFASEEYNEFVFSQFNDVFAFFVDGQNIAFVPGTADPISINTIHGGNPLGQNPENQQFYHNNDRDDNGDFLDEFGYDGFTDVFTATRTGLSAGIHTIKLAISDVGDTVLDSGVFIQAASFSTDPTDPQPPTRLPGRKYDDSGDSNLFRDQGQVLIKSNRIEKSAQFAIVVDAGERSRPDLVPDAGTLPHPGAVRNLRELNTNRLAPGATIVNNVLAFNEQGGIHFSGDANPTGGELAPVPFGRIVNNTIVGRNAEGVGIRIDENASPTVLNNILASLAVGIDIDASSTSTVLGGTLYKDNTANFTNATVGAGSFPIILAGATGPDDSGEPLFMNPATGNFYLEPGSRAIDSAIDSLQDRPSLVTVKTPLGIPRSPILAPERDALGQQRVDDPAVTTPSGQGENVFKDRGAIDRADFIGPSAIMLSPRDNDASQQDEDPRDSFVQFSATLDHFAIQLIDGADPFVSSEGSGIDDASVTRDKVAVFKDGVLLQEGIDYSFNYDRTNNVIRLVPLAGIWEPNAAYVIELVNVDQIVINALPGNLVSDGDQFNITDRTGQRVTFEYESGYSVQVPQTLRLRVPPAGAGPEGIDDGETFTVSDGILTVTFEFDSNGVFTPGNTPITIRSNSTSGEIADAIVAALNSAGLGLSPVNLGGGVVHLGSRAVHTLDTTNSSLTQSGQAANVADGQTFTIDDGTRVVTFEFDSNGAFNPSNRVITFSHAQTHEQIAQSTAAAIAAANLGLTPVHVGDGLVHIGGQLRHIVDIGTAGLVLIGQPGVQSGFGIQIPARAGRPLGLFDGQTFTVSNGTNTVRFELDTNNAVTPGNVRVPFSLSSTLDDVANAIANAIRNANLGLSPTNAGNGRVLLNGSNAQHSLDLTGTTLLQLGQPGVPAAVPIVFVPDDAFTADQMALAIAAAINGSSLVDVTASARNGRVLVRGAVTIEGADTVDLGGIRDLAGNSLQPNQIDGVTRFTVFLSSGFDFGDAPASYGTVEADAGAHHEIVRGFSLGAELDADVDGQPTAASDGDDINGLDDEDGVTFGPLTRGFLSTITVNARGVNALGGAFLDAWFDFNGDGDFNDPLEKVFSSRALVEGDNVLTLPNTIPANAIEGQTYARFRLSSTGGLGPTGFAADGEVEDYRVTINRSPWQNSPDPKDVNDDGFISPIDALLVINDINSSGSRRLPNPPVPSPPPFLDVTGDGAVAPDDVLTVINCLNTPSCPKVVPEGEALLVGEGEGLSGFLAASSVSSTVSAVMHAEAEAPKAISTTAAPGQDQPLFEPIMILPLHSQAGRSSSTLDTQSQPRTTATKGRVEEFRFSLADLQPIADAAMARDAQRQALAEASDWELDDLLSDIADDVEQAGSQGVHDEFFAQL